MYFKAFLPALDAIKQLVLDILHRVFGDEAAVVVDRCGQRDAIIEQLVGLADFLHQAQAKRGIRVDHLAGEREPIGPARWYLAYIGRPGSHMGPTHFGAAELRTRYTVTDMASEGQPKTAAHRIAVDC